MENCISLETCKLFITPAILDGAITVQVSCPLTCGAGMFHVLPCLTTTLETVWAKGVNASSQASNPILPLISHSMKCTPPRTPIGSPLIPFGVNLL